MLTDEWLLRLSAVKIFVMQFELYLVGENIAICVAIGRHAILLRPE